MVEENITQELTLKNIDEAKNYFVEEIDKNEFMSKRHRKGCSTLNYTEHFLILTSAVTGCSSITDFASSLCIRIGITSSAIGLKIRAITARMKK